LLKEKKIEGVTIVDKMQSNEASAIKMQRENKKIVTIISREGLQKNPDKNVAEAMQRVAGAVVQKNKGEGSVVSLRGTPTDWTATTLNGDRLPVADEENTSRTFEFEVLPSNLIDYISVVRSVTPDMEGDNIGGSINFQTGTPPTAKLVKFNFAGGYNELARKPLGEGNLSLGNTTKNGKLGYLVNLSSYNRYYAADVYRLIYGSNFNHGVNRFELKDYEGVRNTFGAHLCAAYKPSARLTLTPKIVFGTMLDDKYQNKTSYNYSDGSGSRVRLQNIHGKLNRRFYGGELGAEWKVNDKLTIMPRLAAYSNDFSYGRFPFKKKDPRNGYFWTEFISPLIQYNDKILIDLYGNQITDPNSPSNFVAKLIGKDDPYGNGDYYKNIQPQISQTLTAKDYEFYAAYSELNHTYESDPIVAQLDVKYKHNDKLTIKAGAKYRLKQGGRELSLQSWYQKYGNGYPTRAKKLTDFETEAFDKNNDFLKEYGSPYTASFMPVLTRNQLSSFLGQLGDTLREVRMASINPDYVFWVGSNYHYQEQTIGGYTMAEGQLGKWEIVGGLRVEYTQLHEYADTLSTKIRLDTASSTYYFPPIRQYTDLKYLAILPSLNLTYNVNDSTKLRYAISRTFHRPNFEETKPGYAVINYNDFLITFGNPKLKPTFSYNFDFTFDKYWGNKGFISIGVYGKYVKDHIFAVMTADIDPLTGIIIKKYDNAPKSYVAGAEFSLQRQFSFLPGFWKGFGINIGATYSFSRMKVPGRNFPQAMTEQTPFLASASLFYEKNKLNIRASFNYTGAYLKELNLAAVKGFDGSLTLLHQNTDFDLFHGPTYTLDFSTSYKLNDKWSAYIEMNNLLNTPELKYIGNKERPYRTEYYRRRGMAGVKFSF
jgi:outer membrane receptor protein involved in Fe transport